jgi:rubrerythrin
VSRRRLAELGPAEVLGLAIDVEKCNAERFETIRDFFSHQDQAIYNLFNELHLEELEHLRILESTAAAMFPKGVPELSEKDVVEVVEAVDVDDGEHAIFDEVTREQALRMALDAERYAKALYEQAAEHATDQQLVKVFETLSQLEGDHEETLLKMLEAAEQGA